MRHRATDSKIAVASDSSVPRCRCVRLSLAWISALALLSACGSADSSDAATTSAPTEVGVAAEERASSTETNGGDLDDAAREEADDSDGAADSPDTEPTAAEASGGAVNFTIDEIFAQSPTSLVFPYGEPDQAECFARYLFGEVGVDRLAEMGVRPGDDVPDIDVVSEFDDSEFVEVSVAAFSTCELAKPFITWQAVSTTAVDPDLLACTIGSLDDATVDEIIGNVMRDQQLFEPGSEAEERIGSQIFDENIECILEEN